MPDANSADPPPGWYARSVDATRLQWWNGTAWTEHHRDAGTTPAAPEMTDASPATPLDPEPSSRSARRRGTATAPPDDDGFVHGEFAIDPTEPLDGPMDIPAVARFGPADKPDMILSRERRIEDDRMPQPLVYRGPATGAPVTPRSTFVPVPGRNGAALASIILTLLSLMGIVAGALWLSDIDPIVTGVVDLVSVGMLGAAFVIAIIAVVISVRRPTKKGEPIFALAVSGLLMVALVGLIVTGMLTLDTLVV